MSEFKAISFQEARSCT